MIMPYNLSYQHLIIAYREIESEIEKIKNEC